jgi:hypothetical protein
MVRYLTQTLCVYSGTNPKNIAKKAWEKMDKKLAKRRRRRS